MLPILCEPLYHGTIIPFKRIDVSRGMMHKKLREALSRRRDMHASDFDKTLYRIRLKPEVLDTLNIKVFSTADMEWLDFILMCRSSDGSPHDYDLVLGPTADDDTMMALKFYRDGAYGMPGTDAAKRLLLQVLETENLGVQCHIGKQSVVDRAVASIEAIDWRVPT